MKNVTKQASIFSAVTAALSVPAFAAVPPGVTSAIGDIGVDGATVAWAVLVGLVAIVAVKYIRKAL